MSKTRPRQTDQIPAELMALGAAIGIVGASLKKHVELVSQLLVTADGLADTSDAAAAALGACGPGLLVVGFAMVLAGIIVIAASPAGHEATKPRPRSETIEKPCSSGAAGSYEEPRSSSALVVMFRP
jgi:hypothetical protein